MGYMLWMAVNNNKKGKFVVLSRVMNGKNDRCTRIFIPEGEKTEGWWNLMEAIYEIFGVKLTPPEWVTKNEKKVLQICFLPWTGNPYVLLILNYCPCCNSELVIRLEKQTLDSFP